MNVRIRAQLLAIALVALIASGCAQRPPRYVDDGVAYTAKSAARLLETSDTGDLAQRPASEGRALRQDALTRLRRTAGGRAAAHLITETFPAASDSVPYHVERGTYDGEEVWIVLEARGRPDGLLDRRQLWVLDPDGSILLFLSR